MTFAVVDVVTLTISERNFLGSHSNDWLWNVPSVMSSLRKHNTDGVPVDETFDAHYTRTVKKITEFAVEGKCTASCFPKRNLPEKGDSFLARSN